MLPEIMPLEWDTDFFGYKIARSDIQQITYEEINELRLILLKNKFELTYCFVNPDDTISANSFLNSKINIVDSKVTLYRNTDTLEISSENEIKEYPLTIPTEEITSLALQSGIYSRFHLDKNFKNNEYEKLYKTWLEKSIRKELAEKVFVSVSENKIVGLITLGIKNNRGDIGLVAVDKNSRGKSIGKNLITFSINYFKNKGINQIQVVTQKQNEAAMKLYASCGFTIESIMDIYHLWSIKK